MLLAAFPNNIALSNYNATSKFIIEDTVPCNLNLSPLHSYYTLVIGFPEGEGGPWADVGGYGNFIGTLQQISALVVGEMWGLFWAVQDLTLNREPPK